MIYLIHFDLKLHHAQHYLGYTDSETIGSRIERHRSGNGSKLMRAVTLAGIPWNVVRTWSGDRNMERRLKNWKKSSQLCPVCRKGKAHAEKN
jgi:predicted GIY-YIG superfamily endonuclease